MTSLEQNIRRLVVMVTDDLQANLIAALEVRWVRHGTEATKIILFCM